AYEIVVRNPGPTAMHQVRVEDELPAGAKFLSGDPPPEVTADQMSWTLNTLEPGTERRIHVKIQPGPGTEINSTATVHYASTASLHTRIAQPRMVLAMRGPEQVGPGENVPFHVMVTNPGTTPITNLVLHCKLPEGLTHPQGQVVEAEIGNIAAG